MKYAALVARREYLENARTKGFWIGMLLFPAVLFLSIQVPVWLREKATPVRYYVLVDQSGTLAPAIESSLDRSHQRQVLDALRGYARKYATEPAPASRPDPLAEFSEANPRALQNFMDKGGQDVFLRQLQPRLQPDAPAFEEPRRKYQRVELPPGIHPETNLDSLAQELKPYLRGDQKVEVNGQPFSLSAAILIPRNIRNQVVRPGAKPAAKPGEPAGIQFWSMNVADPDRGLRERVEQAVNNEIRRREYLARGMNAAAIRQVEQTYAPFVDLNPKKAAGKEAVNAADVIRQWAPSAFVYLLWISIFMIVQMLLTNIIEEKSNRIIEVLLSSVTPGELMMGKLFGIAAIGLTMVAVWMATLFGVLTWKTGGSAQIAGPILTVLKTSRLLPVFSIYFLFGYLMYAAAILSLGSVCNTLKEAQSYMGVITIIMVVPLLTMAYIPTDPNGTLARVLSWIPVYTPFIMMNRANADPPLIDLIGTMVLLILSTAGAIWMAGKIFRIGVLRTGQPPRILEMLRWLKG